MFHSGIPGGARDLWLHRRATGRHGDDLVLGRARRGYFELQSRLVEQLVAALGGLPVLLPPQLGDLQLVVGDERLCAGSMPRRCSPVGYGHHVVVSARRTTPGATASAPLGAIAVRAALRR